MKKLHVNNKLKNILYGGTMSDADIVKELNDIAVIMNNKLKFLEAYYDIKIKYEPLPTNNSDALKNSTTVAESTSIVVGPFGEILPVTTVLEFSTPSYIPIMAPVLTPMGIIPVPTLAVNPFTPSDTIEKRCEKFKEYVRIYEEIKNDIATKYTANVCTGITGRRYLTPNGTVLSIHFTPNATVCSPITPTTPTPLPTMPTPPLRSPPAPLTPKEKALEDVITKVRGLPTP